MILHGREIGFCRTVKVTCDLAKLCPNEDIQRLGEVINESRIGTTQETMAKLIISLNEGYEMRKAFENEGYQPRVLTMSEVMYATAPEWNGLVKEALKAFHNDGSVTVETEPEKKTE